MNQHLSRLKTPAGIAATTVEEEEEEDDEN